MATMKMETSKLKDVILTGGGDTGSWRGLKHLETGTVQLKKSITGLLTDYETVFPSTLAESVDENIKKIEQELKVFDDYVDYAVLDFQMTPANRTVAMFSS